MISPLANSLAVVHPAGMKLYLFLSTALTLLILTGCASVQKPPQACLYLDDKTGFSRCETSEVVCYESRGGQACWPKPEPKPSAAPQAQAAPLPTPMPKAKAPKHK